MSVSPYLFFDGNCRQAFEQYRSVFGGEFTLMMTFSEGPSEMKVPDGEANRIMHVSLPVGSSVLMGSDTISTMGPPSGRGGSVSVAVEANSREHADELFAGLSDGGEVGMAMDDTFWGAYFGTCTDRFGMKWMVSFDQSPG